MANILDEIIKKSEDRSFVGSVFNLYRDKREIGKMIFDELIAKKYSRKQTNRGFFMAENERNKIGIISHCLGLQSLALSKQFDVNLFSTEKETNDRTQIILDTLKSIFNSLTLTQEKVNLILNPEAENRYSDSSLYYDATPFVDNSDMDDETLQIKTYVDTMAKVLETFCEFRSFNNALIDQGIILSIEGFDSLANAIDALIIRSMHDLNESAIPTENEIEYKIGSKTINDILGRGCLYKGWNYTAVASRYEPSLYFTYAVSSAYMAFYGNFNFVINACRNIEQSAQKLFDEGKEKEAEKILSDLKNEIIPTINLKGNLQFNRNYEFLKLAYKEYKGLNKRCVDAGHYIDIQITNAKLDITQSFIGLGYNSVTYEEILNSTTNDALINTLLVALILVYSGIDNDYKAVNKLEDFNDRLEYSIQNVLKVYKSIERLNRSYIVDQYFLSFNEKLPEELQDQVKLLRKQRILAASLMPLLIKSYTAMSKYMVCYPQKQMQDYLKIILENRYFDKHTSSKIWLWDKDGYNISINLLYILNLLDFYTYYEKYELPYTNDTETYTYKIEQKDKEHALELENINDKYNAQIDDLTSTYNKEKKSLEENIDELKAKIGQFKPLEQEVVNVVEEYLKDHLGELIAQAFNNSRQDLLKDNQNELSKAFLGLFLAHLKDEFLNYGDEGELFSKNDNDPANDPKYLINEKKFWKIISSFIVQPIEGKR